MSFGQWPAVGLADARRAVAEVKVQLAKGEDPQSRKDAVRHSGSVAEALELYSELHLAKLKTGKATRQTLNSLLAAVINRPLASVTEADIVRIQNS